MSGRLGTPQVGTLGIAEGLVQGDVAHPYGFALSVTAKSDIVLQAKASTGSIRCAGGYNFVLF